MRKHAAHDVPLPELAPDHEVSRWLREFEAASENFDWDEGNRNKSLKHGASWEDIESLFLEEIVFEGRITEPAHDESRYLLLGEDWNGRLLALVFTRRGDKLRPISCRTMRHKERERYEERTS